MPTPRVSRGTRLRRGLLALAVTATSLAGLTALPATVPATAAVALNDSEVTANLWEWNWRSVAAACTDHLGPAGYGAVQVAPPQESVSLPTSADGVHPWYEVYQPVSYRLESRFGTRQQFADMVTTCHNAGVRVYVDAVVNHMAGANNPESVVGYAGTDFSGPGYSFPAVPYGTGDFHRPGDNCPTSGAINDWNNEAQVTSCELLSLTDLYTEKDSVRTTIAGFLNDLVGLGVDGFRVDAVKHVRKDDFAAILGKVRNTTAENRRPYVAQEIFDGASNDALKARAFTGNGDVLDFGYAKGLKSAFQGSIANLANVGSWNLDAPSANVFAMVTNHDLERDGVVLSYRDGSDYVLANYFALAYPHGKPSVYDSFTWSNRNQSPPADGNGYVTDTVCGGSWNCLTRSTGIKGMVGWANAAKSVKTVSDFTVVNSNVIGFHRGDRAWIGINDSGSAVTATFTTGLADGSYCDVISGARGTSGCTGTTVTVSGGRAAVQIPANGAVALHVNAKGGPAATPTATPTPTASATPTPTAPAGTVATTFTVTAALAGDQSVHVVGSVPALGSWAPVAAVPLTAQGGGTYRATVTLPASSTVEFKFLKKTTAGVVTWESGSNRTLTTPSGGTASVTDTFRGDPAGTQGASFTVNATTSYGQNVYVVGSVAALGSWNPANAVALSSAAYPLWRATVALPANTSFEYKYLKKNPDGTVTWESGGNRSATVGSTGSWSANDTWR
ncbi:carbohydrate-binding module family 20 domain-containing protein [Micromonospora sp. HUAS LYJ1]|uniref:carbohydrate-binding module family 20 domain-containing protein n=1 Tax=Micromonospora sp. HUAS LYJ1 TaxID=3061626 RepID=UPI0026722E96|nr:carbohydrate-binding module family 20 domain-containing protein [Micromonospora sp. HUAS LYJ1]WKU06264.1 carbohydrate-binding module family 20 domain-containing protein [Micromonospora sp. HUAS LYJ1]